MFQNFFLILLILVFFTKPSAAYIDPGTGSMILQILGSMLVGCLVFFRTLKIYFLNAIDKTKSYIKNLSKTSNKK